MMKCLLFKQLTSNLRRLACKVKVFANRFSCHRPISSKSVVIEGIARFLQLLPKPIVGLFKIEHLPIVVTLTSTEAAEWIMLFKDAS